ncbi:hypothetical protein B9Z65_2071 [Elsinoe australis]|uniref:Macro domain-containing protein n=1 Tax=Elsinoe australis TaxID=40998 RepID=A0A2P7YMZ7_9PEZI|nr:hypothetical protein B9Z65_2071 [Elsinoe australis]
MAKLLSLSEIPTIASLYASSTLHSTSHPPSPLHSLTQPPRTPAFNTRLHLIKHDITRLRLTAIVNAANTSLLGGGGVDGAIHRAAGPELLEECETLDGCETGDAKVTGGYELPARHVIHAVGPVYGVERKKREGREEELLGGCYVRSMELAAGLRREDGEGVSVGFSGLSTGVYGYPKGEAARVAVATVVAWLEGEKERAEKEGREERVRDVVFVCFEQKDFDAYVKWLPQFCPPAEEGGKDEAGEGAQGEAAETKVTDEAKADEKLDLPSPPTEEPKLPGEPDSKKVKTTHESEEKA